MSIVNFNVTVTGQEPVVDKSGLILTSGSKGVYTTTFSIDDTWSNLALEAVFIAAPPAWPINHSARGIVRRSVPLENNTATVDSDVLAKPGLRLWVGLQGLDEEGTIVKNSTLALVDKIQHGADPDGPGDGDIPATRYESLKQMATNTSNEVNDIRVGYDGTVYETAGDAVRTQIALAMESGGSVKTVNGVAPDENGNVEVEAGGGSGGQPVAATTAAKMTDTGVIYVYMGTGETVDGVTYTTGHMYYYNADTSAWADSGLYGVGKAGKDGQDGQDGSPGEDGYSPSVSVSETDTGVKITVTDQSGTTETTVENGTATDEQVAAWLDAHPEATTTVQDGAISPNKTTFFKETKTYYNLYNPATTTAGQQINCTNGTVRNSTYGYLTDYIKVQPGKSYYYGKANGTNGSPLLLASSWAVFDSDKNCVPQTDTSLANLLTSIPDGVEYIRITIGYGDGATSIMFIEGSEVPTTFVSYEDGISLDAGWTDDVLRGAILKDAESHMRENLTLPGSRIEDGTLSFVKNEFATVYNLNIVNPDEIIPQTMVGANDGKEGAYSFTDVTGFCPVTPGKKYWSSAFNQNIVWYDKDKKYISSVTNNSGSIFVGHTAPENAAYLRANVGTGGSITISDYGLNTSYVDYGTKITEINEADVTTALNSAVQSVGNVPLFAWEKWNLADKHKYFSGNMDSNGVVSFVGSGGNVSGYIVDVEPQTEYVYFGRVSIHQFSEDWAYVGVKTGAWVNAAWQSFTTDSDVFHVIIQGLTGICAVSDSTKNGYMIPLASNTAEENFAVKYLPVGANPSATAAAVSILLGGNSAKINQAIHNSKGLKWVCLGDSLTTNSWGHTMYNLVSEKLGLEPVNYGIVSSTLADYKQDGTTQNPMCVRYIEMDDDADIVTVMGGTNDYIVGDLETDTENTATVVGACHALFSGLIDKYPNAKIGVILPPQWGYGIPSWVETQGGDPNMDGLRSTVNAVKAVAEYYSLPVCDLFNHGGIPGMLESTIGRLLQQDHVHLTTAGHEVLSRPLLAFIKDLIG